MLRLRGGFGRWLLALGYAVALIWMARLLGMGTHARLWLSVALGLIFFVLPGGLLITAAQGCRPVCIPRFISYGFTTSLVLISALGIFARTLHWTLDGILAIWVGLTVASALFFAHRSRGQRIIGSRPSEQTLLCLLSMLAVLSLFAFSGMHHQPLNDDQHSYHAEVLGFLDGEPFDWQEIYFDSGETISARFYLSYWTLAQALISAVSGQHILQMDFVINSLLMLIALCSVHAFARDMGASSRAAWLIALLHLLCLSLMLEHIRQPGGQFYSRILEDKLVAGFVVAPLAISAAYRASKSFCRSRVAEFALAFLGVMFAHMMMAGFVVVAILIFGALRIIFERTGRSQAMFLIALTLLLFSPGFFLRLQLREQPSVHNYGDEGLQTNRDVLVLNMRSPLDGSPLVLISIRPQAVGLLLMTLLALVLPAAALRGPDAESWLMAALVVTAGIGLFPLTAWLYARLVSANHMMRVMWILPFGYMLAFVCRAVWSRWGAGMATSSSRLHIGALALFGLPILSSAYFLTVQRGVDFSRDIGAVIDSRQDLIALGDFVEAHHDERVLILGNLELRHDILSSSPQVMTLSHYRVGRMMSYSSMSLEEAQRRTDDHFNFWTDEVPLGEKLAILDRYAVDYLLYAPDDAGALQPLFAIDELQLETVADWEMFALARIGKRTA